MNISEIFLIFLILSTIFSYKYLNSLTTHGYTNKKLSKNLFSFFYLFAIFLYLITSKRTNIYILHLCRRFVETLIFKYSKYNKMSLLQFIVPFFYYYFIVINIVDKEIENIFFILFNITQFIVHWMIHNKLYQGYGHYFCEFMIYLVIFANVKNCFFFLNLIWIIIYSYITIQNRRKLVKKI